MRQKVAVYFNMHNFTIAAPNQLQQTDVLILKHTG